MEASSKDQFNDEETPLVPNDLESDFQPSGGHKSRARSSIFDAKSLQELEKVAGEKAVDFVTTTTPAGFVIQMVLFFMLCLTIGLTPFFTQILLRDPVTGIKNLSFIPQTPYLVNFLISVVLSNILSLLLYGTEGLKACWDMKSILRLSPVSLLYGTAQSIEVVAMVYLDSAFRTILNQLKLPLSAILQRLILGEKRSVLQWLLVAATTTSVFGFIFAKLGGGSLMANSARVGIGLGCAAVSCSFFASWMTDVKTKKMDNHLIVQVAQLRVTTAIVVAGYTVGWAVWNNQMWKLIVWEGWTMSVFGLSCFLVLKDFLLLYVLKRLSNLWLGLATCMGLGVSYIADILFLDQKFDTICFTFIVLVSILVIAWPASKNK